MAAGAGNREAVFVEQTLDFENRVDVFTAVEAVAGGGLYGLERGDFLLPVAQDEGLRPGEAADFADAE